MKAITHLNDYISYLEKNHYAKNTIDAYYFGLNFLNRFLVKNNTNVKSIKRDDIDLFVNFAVEKVAKTTVNGYLACLSNYLNFLKKYKKYKFDFELNEIKRIKTIKRTKGSAIDQYQIEKILKNIQEKKYMNHKRDYIIIQLIIKTGIRVSDLAKIKKEDIDLNAGKITINSDDYSLDRELNNLITSYLKNIGNAHYIFTPKTSTKSKNLTRRTFSRIIKKYFPHYHYNDLKLAYYKTLCDNLPNIASINYHQHGGVIKIQDIVTII